VADPLRFFKGPEVLHFSSAFLCFHGNEFNLDPCVEGIGDSGERTECDISCGSLDQRYFRGVHSRACRKLRLIQIFPFPQPGNLDAQLKIYQFLLDQVPNRRVLHLLFIVTIQAGSHSIHLLFSGSDFLTFTLLTSFLVCSAIFFLAASMSDSSSLSVSLTTPFSKINS